MNITIIGSGISGILSAYYLLRLGHTVKIIEDASTFASKASAANASQLSYTYVNPLGQPSIFKMLPKIITGKSDAIKIRDWGFDTIGFGIKFLCQSTRKNFINNRAKLLEMSLASKELYKQIICDTNIKRTNYSAGKIQIFHEDALVNSAKEFAQELKNNFSIDLEMLDKDQCHSLLPSINIDESFKSAVYSKDDDTISCYDFCKDLLKFMEINPNFSIKYNTKISSFISDTSSIKSAVSKGGHEYNADKFLLCTGAYSNKLLDSLSIKVPIYPIKGYTLIYDTPPEFTCSITDHQQKIVLVPFGDKILASGTFHFDKTTSPIDKQTVDYIHKCASKRIDALKNCKYTVKTGYRPCTPSSVPLVGKLNFDNLYMNSGHGMYGWTIGAACASSIADIMYPTSHDDLT